MPRLFTLLVFVFGIVCTVTPVRGAPHQFEVHPADGAVEIDGTLDEQAWTTALTLSLDYEYQPRDNIEAVVATEAMITFDERFVYVAFRAFDPDPSAIRAHLMDRDQINTFVQDDHVVVMIDTFNDERRAFQLRVNPLGVQADAIFSEIDGIEDFSWDFIWHSAGRITDFGYVVEIAIPVNQIRFPRVDGEQVWGFDLTRSYPRSVRHRFAAVPKDRNSPCALCQEFKIAGFTGLLRGRNIEFDPTVTALRTDAVESPGDGNLVRGDEDVELGISGEWGMTANLSLSAAINPDFSQVEADAAQLEVNERFALFYPEKRPFFLEGIDFFSTPIQAVFTRTVFDPEWGLKVTGKEGRHGIGVFVTDDQVNNLLIPSNQETSFAQVQQSVRSVVLRDRLDIGRGSTVGVLLTSRDGDGYHNRVAGLDGFFRLSTSNSVRFQYLASETEYPEEIAAMFGQPDGAFRGYAAVASAQHASRNWFGRITYEDYDPQFRADNGFVPRVDLRTLSGVGQRTWWGKDNDWYTAINLGTSVSRSYDHDGDRSDELVHVFANVGGPWQSRFAVNIDQVGERFAGIYYDSMLRVGGNLEVQPSGSLRLAFAAVIGDSIDYVNARQADQIELRPSIELKMGRRVSAALDHSMRRLEVTGEELFTANLSQLSLRYHPDVRTMVRATFQYFDLDSNLALYSEPKPPATEKKLYSELLFSFKLNPQTVLFAGYSDNRRGFDGVSMRESDRTLFIKIGYAWVL